MRTGIFLLIFAIPFALQAEQVQAPKSQRLPMRDVLEAAVANSKQLVARKDRERIVEFKRDLARTGELPTVSLEALTTSGFPGSTGLLGVGGVMGSSYRSGWAYGVVATDTLWDFGKTSRAMAAAEADVQSERQLTGIEKQDVLRTAFEAYLRCSFVQSEIENWAKIRDLSIIIEREVEKFVKTGQHSIVDTYLVKSQVDQAARKRDRFTAELEMVRRRLSILTGWPVDRIACENISALKKEELMDLASDTNPLLEKAKADIKAAEAHLREVSATDRPKLVALASAGDMENTRLVDRKNYALGLGLIIPIYDGSQTSVLVDRAKVDVLEQTHRQEAAQQFVDHANARFDESISSFEAEVKGLAEEFRDAQKGFQKAKERYFSMRGGLADLREAVRNLSRVQTELSQSQSELLRSLGLKYLFNGK